MSIGSGCIDNRVGILTQVLTGGRHIDKGPDQTGLSNTTHNEAKIHATSIG